MAAGIAPAGSNGRPLRAHLAARWVTIAVGALCVAVAWLFAGPAGAGAAALATILVVGFFWSGAIPVLLSDRARLGPGAGLAVLLLTYTLRLAVVLLLLRLLSRADIVDERWLGVTIIACALIWTVVHVGAATRRMPSRSSADNTPPP